MCGCPPVRHPPVGIAGMNSCGSIPAIPAGRPDPSGLSDAYVVNVTAPLETITPLGIYDWFAGRWRSFNDWNGLQVGVSRATGTAHEIAVDLQDQVRRGVTSDCNALAQFADELSFRDMPMHDSEFIGSFSVFIEQAPFGSGLVGVSSSGLAVSLQNSAVPSGYRQEFREMYGVNADGSFNPGNRDDQSHHFAASFQFGAGFFGGLSQVESYMHDMSNGGNVNIGDMNLALVAADIGLKFRSGYYNRVDVGIQIRAQICEPVWSAR